MRLSTKLKLAFLISSVICLVSITYAIPSGGVYPPEFTYRNGYWYDSWGYNRNYYAGENGFLPNVAYESLGSYKQLAYEIGEWFAENYDNEIERAEAILDYVQRWTDYGYDEDNVVRNGIAQVEWAWNADEMAHMFDESQNLVAIGDCEDMTFLCATLYVASKIDVALVDAPGHVSLLIWLPEYANANHYWDIPNDGRDHGWIWVEATGEVNPLGWTPPDFSDGEWDAHIIGFSKFSVEYSPRNPKEEDDITVKAVIESATSSINSVYLSYTIGTDTQEVQMINKGSYYEEVIPKQLDGTRVKCKVYAIDDEDFISEQRFEYIVGQEIQLPPYLIEAGLFLFIIFIIVSLIARS